MGMLPDKRRKAMFAAMREKALSKPVTLTPAQKLKAQLSWKKTLEGLAAHESERNTKELERMWGLPSKPKRKK